MQLGHEDTDAALQRQEDLQVGRNDSSINPSVVYCCQASNRSRACPASFRPQTATSKFCEGHHRCKEDSCLHAACVPQVHQNDCWLPPAAIAPRCWCRVLQAAALLLCEVFLVGAATADAEVMDIASLKRLLFDVFHEDVALFKEYCLQVRVEGLSGWWVWVCVDGNQLVVSRQA